MRAWKLGFEIEGSGSNGLKNFKVFKSGFKILVSKNSDLRILGFQNSGLKFAFRKKG